MRDQEPLHPEFWMTNGLTWIGIRGEDARMFDEIVPVRSIVCCDWSPWLQEASRRMDVRSLERSLAARSLYHSSKLDDLLGPLEKQETSFPGSVIPYRSLRSPTPPQRPSALRSRILSTPWSIIHRIEDKVWQRRILQSKNIHVPEWLPMDPELGWEDVEKVLGSELILQPTRGSLGIGTRSIHGRDEWMAWRLEEKEGTAAHVVSKRIDGPCFNVSGVVGLSDVALGWPSAVIIGRHLHELGLPEYLYCGNDFTATNSLSPTVIENLWTITRNIGIALKSQGFQGFFGIDAILDEDNGWVVLEINPRFQGSTPALARFERAADDTPLVAYHLAAFGHQVVGLPQKRRPRPLHGSMLVGYAQRDGTSSNAIVQDEGPTSGPNHDLGSRPVLTGRPVSGTQIHRGANLFRLLSEEHCLTANLERATQEVQQSLIAQSSVLLFD